jgi:polar amino acid transport system permease protein
MRFDWSFAAHILPILLKASIVTVVATAVAFAGALVGGLVIISLRRSHPILDKSIGNLAEFIRNTPLLVQILFLYMVLPNYGVVLAPLSTGILALSLHYSCYISEVYRAGLEGIPQGQWDASVALNFSKLRTYRSIILPQMVPTIVPSAGNFLVYMFKDSPYLAAISVAELVFTAQMIGADTFRYTEPMTLVGLIFLAMGLIAAALIGVVERLVGAKWTGRRWSH